MAEYEAALITERTLAGLTAAPARGRTGGRKPKMTPALTHKAQRMYDSKRFTMAEIAASCGVTPMTIYRHITTNPPAATAQRGSCKWASPRIVEGSSCRLAGGGLIVDR